MKYLYYTDADATQGLSSGPPGMKSAPMLAQSFSGFCIAASRGDFHFEIRHCHYSIMSMSWSIELATGAAVPFCEPFSFGFSSWFPPK